MESYSYTELMQKRHTQIGEVPNTTAKLSCIQNRYRQGHTEEWRPPMWRADYISYKAALTNNVTKEMGLQSEGQGY